MLLAPRRKSCVIEVGEDGAVGHCEFPYVDHLPPPEFACVCGVLRTMRFGQGSAGRRASFALDIKRREQKTAHARLGRHMTMIRSRATDATATLGTDAIDEPALESCLLAIKTDIGWHDVPARFTIGPDGRVQRHETTWPDAIPAATRRCLDTALAAAQFNCPLSGASVVTATFQLRVTK